MRKPVFGVSNQVQHKPGCTATEDGKRLEISDLGRRGIVLSVWPKQRRWSASRLPRRWSVSLFSHMQKADFLTTRHTLCKELTPRPSQTHWRQHLTVFLQSLGRNLSHLNSNPRDWLESFSPPFYDQSREFLQFHRHFMWYKILTCASLIAFSSFYIYFDISRLNR